MGLIAIIEDDPLIALDLMQRLSTLTKCDVFIFETFVVFKNATVTQWGIVFCNLHLTDGWLSQEDLQSAIDSAIVFVVFTGFSDWPSFYTDLHGHVLLLYKPFTSIELKKLLDP